MVLNKELLTRLRAVEAEFGHVNNWPASELTEIRAIANREPDEVGPDELMEVRELAERGFFVTRIAIRLHRSRGWVLKRLPDDIEYVLVEEDRRVLRYYRHKTIKETASKLQRNADWVREMRKKL